MDYGAHRPKGFQGQGDSHLPQIAKKLRQALSKTQRGFAYDSLRLPPKALGELAGILVDFAEDLHNDTGIWAAYERYNAEFFGTALPLTSEKSDGDFHSDRFFHFLWVLYPTFIAGLTLSPTHQDLRRVADAVSAFLSEAFSAVPKDSGVKAFLGTPNAHGWDVKRKLIWLGTHSFLFRTHFAHYMEDKTAKESEITRTDDFVCGAGDDAKVDSDFVKKTMERHSPRIVCRYSRDYEAQVRQKASDLYKWMLDYHGRDLVMYPDGLTMAAGWQKEFRAQCESRPQDMVPEVIKKHGLKKARPEVRIPEDLLGHKDGLGVFLNPDEGKEIIDAFHVPHRRAEEEGRRLDRGRGDEHSRILGVNGSQSEVRPAGAGGIRRRVREEGIPAEGRPAGLLAGLSSAEPQGTLLPEAVSDPGGGLRGMKPKSDQEPPSRSLCPQEHNPIVEGAVRWQSGADGGNSGVTGVRRCATSS